jgi:hypothetical protein
MLKDGAEFEIHVAVKFVSRLFGSIAGPLIGGIAKILAGIMVAIYCRKFALYLFVVASIISLWAAWYNIWGVNVYSANILKWLP